MRVLRRCLQALALLWLLTAAAAPARAQFTFGNVEVGHTVSLRAPVFIACGGGVTYTVTGTHAADFQVSGPSAHNPTQLFVTVRFTPSGLGPRAALLTVQVGVCSAQLELTGTGVPPRIECPANLTVSSAPNQCGAVVNYPAPTSIGAAGAITTVPPSGSFFPVGTTTVTATSASGATCSFTVTVRDTQPPSLTCPPNRTVDAPPGSCAATVNIVSPVPALTPTVTDNCGGAGTLRYAVANNIITVPITFPPSPPAHTIAVTLAVGTYPVLVTATDAAGNTATCTYTITVRDTQPPSITCPPSVIVPTLAGQRAGSFIPTPPAATDNCPGVTVTGTRSDGHALTDRYPVGATIVTWTATDTSGNQSRCTQLVQVHDPVIVGVVGLDSNANGLPDPLEPRLKGVVIELRDPARDELWAANPTLLPKPEPLDWTTTNEVGNFTFRVTPPATYDVVVQPGPGQTISALFPGPTHLVRIVTVNGEPRLRVTLSPGQTAAGLGVLLK